MKRGYTYQLFDSLWTVYTALDKYLKDGHDLPLPEGNNYEMCTGGPSYAWPKGAILMEYLTQVKYSPYSFLAQLMS